MTPLTIKMAHRRSVLSVAAAFLILLLTLGLLATTENTLWWFAYAATVTAAIASFIAFATRRLLFAGVTTLVLLCAGALMLYGGVAKRQLAWKTRRARCERRWRR